MFYYLNGVISAIEANLAVVDCGGVGFACNTTGYTLSQLQVGKQQKLFTHCNVREDAFDIYGFSTKEELSCFERLIGVSGVGPKAGLAILSAMTPSQFSLAVMTGDEKTLTMAQGVGKKMAQRIILELKALGYDEEVTYTRDEDTMTIHAPFVKSDMPVVYRMKVK